MLSLLEVVEHPAAAEQRVCLLRRGVLIEDDAGPPAVAVHRFHVVD